jgi:hypothetical protein
LRRQKMRHKSVMMVTAQGASWQKSNSNS